VSTIARIRPTAPFLRLFVPNSLTVHPRSFSLKALLAASSFCPITPGSNYSPAVTSSPFLSPAHLERFPVNLPEDPVVSHSLHTFIHRTFTLSWEAGASVLPVPPLLEVSFPVLEGVDPSTRSNACFVVPEDADTSTTLSFSAIRNCVAVP
jgi:hypothetical protein